jgi:CheY-like chemotaxis protein
MFTLRLLIVERSKGLQTFVRQLFENFGFDPAVIKCADSPQAALEIAADLRPDFVLTDWFPKEELSGIGLHQKLVLLNPDCKFALLSADVGPEKTEAARNAGAIFLLAKPCSAVDLRTALGKALQQLSAEIPKLNSHVGEVAMAAARHLSALTMAAKLPNFTPGEKVVYQGRTDSVRHVILRQGTMAVQLEGVPGLVPATEVHKV